MKRVMFVCRKNSARSQMAEGFARALGVEVFAVTSSGLEASFINPLAVTVMAELGIDISQQTSKALGEFRAQDFDIVISLCGCGVNLPSAWVTQEEFEDWQLDDPVDLEMFRSVRDQIRERVIALVARHTQH